MKKIISYLFLALVTVVIVGCDKPADKPVEPTPPAAPTNAPAAP